MHPREWRIRKRKTLEEVGKLIGKSAVAVSKYERGLLTPRPKVMEAYKKVSRNSVKPEDFLALRR